MPLRELTPVVSQPHTRITGPGELMIPAALPRADNVVTNSSWAGMSGSVGGADFVTPTGWTLGFWPPDEAITIPEIVPGANGIDMAATANRGYLTQAFDSTGLVGEFANISCFVDARPLVENSALVAISAGATLVGQRRTGTRVFAVYRIDGDSIQFRCGAGVTTNQTQDFTVSRPQVTLGQRLYPYDPT